MRQAAAAVTVGTYSPWEPTATRCAQRGRLGGARRFGAHRVGEGRGHIVAAPAQIVRDGQLALKSSYCNLRSAD